MKVYGYVRVSTAEQATNGDSLETQRNQVLGYAMMKGWTVAEVFVERGVSGSTPFAERPEGERLLATLNKGDAIISPKLDRAFRSASDALTTLEEMKADGVTLHLIDLGGDVTGNGIGKLTFTILAAVAENERDRIRERIRDVKRHLAAQGVYGGGKVPFGWTVGPDGKHLVTNPEEQSLIHAMVKLQREGFGYRQIGRSFGKEATTVKRILERNAQMQVVNRHEIVERIAEKVGVDREA